MFRRLKITLFILIVVLASVAPLVFISGCNDDKYSALYGTYYYQAGSCATATEPPYNNISITNSIEGEFAPKNFYVKIEKNKFYVRGSFSPEVSGVNVKFKVSADKGWTYTDISFVLTEDGNFYNIICDNEETGWKVSVSGNVVSYQYGYGASDELIGTRFCYQLIYEKD